MVRLELDQVVMRRMKEDDIEVVKALIKEGCEGTENRLILHILTRPLCLFILAVFSSILRCLVHSFILALAIPVFLLIVFLKITMPRSTGVLGSSRPYWDYVGSSYRGTQDETLKNPYCRISGKTPVTKRPRRRIAPKDKDKEISTEKITPEREMTAGQVWVADCDGDILGCIFRESENRADIRRICRLVTGSWYRREGLGRLLVQSLEQRERETGAHRVYAHVPYPSKVAEAFFRKLGYQQPLLCSEEANGARLLILGLWTPPKPQWLPCRGKFCGRKLEGPGSAPGLPVPTAPTESPSSSAGHPTFASGSSSLAFTSVTWRTALKEKA